jgi:hypothetical protein
MNKLNRLKTIFNIGVSKRNKSRKVFCEKLIREKDSYFSELQAKYYYLVF